MTQRTLSQVALTLACLLLLGWTTAAAQMPTAEPTAPPDGQPTTVAAELQRNLQRSAPVRTPRILSQGPITQGVSAGSIHTVVELPPVADTYIASGRPGQNFGADSLYLGYNFFGDNFGAQRILIRFDVDTNLPDNIIVQSARLRLRLAFASPSDDEPMGTVLRRLNSSWNEFGVTWNSEPEWTDIDDRTSVGSALDWYEWDVTAEVQAWADGAPNDGMEIIGDERVQQRERAFYSRETTTGFFPRLVVDYMLQTEQEAPVVTVNPLPPFVGRNFTVSWSGYDPGGSGIDTYDVQYRIDDGDWVDWLTDVTITSEEFQNGQNGRRYEFRARGVDNAGNEEAYGDAEAATVVDTQPPTATVNPLPAVTNVSAFPVSWSDTDNGGSGIQYYDVYVRFNNGGWILWQTQTTATSATFGAQEDGLYEFEARAVDNRGLVEALTGQAEAATIVDVLPPFVRPEIWLPFVAYNSLPPSK